MDNLDSRDLIAAGEVCRMLGGISDMSIWRLLHGDPTFPRPMRLVARGRRYWRRGDLERWLAARKDAA